METERLLAGIRAVIYDLDGTLYDDTGHFDRYAELLADALPQVRRTAFLADYAAAAAGRHTLQVGCLYDAARDLVLTVAGGRVLAARSWDGAPAPAALYPAAPAADQHRVLNVGDLWWVLAAAAVHHGLRRDDIEPVFLRLRAYMAGPDFRLRPVPGLAAALAELRRRGVFQAVATNSPEPDSLSLLRKAGLAGLLHRRC